MSMRHSDHSLPLLPGSPCLLHPEAIHKVSPGLWSSQPWAPQTSGFGDTQNLHKGGMAHVGPGENAAPPTHLRKAWSSRRVQSGCRPQHQPGCGSDCTSWDLSFVICKVDMMMVPTSSGWHEA